jgi:histidinol-phosphate aminotransferase
MSSHPLVPNYIAALAPYQPGKPIEVLRRELGASWPAEGAVKLASNENPLGPSPSVRAALIDADVSRYPDAGSYALRDKLAKQLSLSVDQILIGSGSNEIINLAVQTFCGPGEEVLTPELQFICYELAAQAFDRPLKRSPNRDGFALDLDALLRAVTPRTKLVFLATPNNPTGAALRREEIFRLVRELPAEVVLILDEAYAEYGAEQDRIAPGELLALRERLVLMRTFSKIHGLAGLRVGYAMAAPVMCELMNRARLPFNVTTLGHIAAMAALDDPGHVARSREMNDAGRTMLVPALTQLGFAVAPSQGNFVLAEVPKGHTGLGLFDLLQRRGVIVRPLMPYKLPNHLRISVGTEKENQRLIHDLRVVLGVA